MAEGEVSTTLSEWLLVALIVFSLVFELGLHRVEHWVRSHHNHLVSVLRVLYRELMVLGLVSFSFVVYTLTAKPNDDTKLSFEFAHIFIFLLAIFYTFVVLCTMFISLSLSARWKKMERMDLVHYLSLKDKYSQIRATINHHQDTLWKALWWFPNVRLLFRYLHMNEIMAFHDIRFQFIYFRNLPEDFRFSSFLRMIKSITFVDLVESHWSLWCIFLIVVLCDIFRRVVIVKEPAFGSKFLLRAPADGPKNVKFGETESIFIICIAIALTICTQILAFKIRYVYWRLTRHPRTYYEGVQAEAVEEELRKAKEQRAQERQKRRSQSMSRGSGLLDNANQAPHQDSKIGHEAEMLDPMHPKPLQSPLVTPRRSTDMGHSAANSAAPSASAGSFMVGQPAPLSSNDESLRDAVRNQADDAQRARMELTPSALAEHQVNANDYTASTSAHGGATDANDSEIASRHSLEAPRPNGSQPSLQQAQGSSASSTSATLARAAVEAARRRAVVDGSGSATGSKRVGTLTRPISSPNFASQFSSRRGSLDSDAAHHSTGDALRSSLDRSSNRGGGRVSIELAVAMPRDELAIRFENGSRVASDLTDLDGTGVAHNAGASTITSISIPEKGDFQTHEIRKTPVGPKDSMADTIMSASTVTSAHAASSVNGYKEPRIRFHGNASNATLSTTNDEVRIDLTEHPSKSKIASDNSSGEEVANPTIMSNFQEHRDAQQKQPNSYPKIVTKLFPRLNRVASRLEKLFWFGSHKFFMWCVEFVLFFSTVILAAASAGISLVAVEKGKIEPINIVAVCLTIANLLFVLFRIAIIVKRYIFILHNASLIPEVVAMEAIKTVRDKSDKYDKRVTRTKGSISGSDTEGEDGDAARERRKRLGRFFRSEAENGQVRGIDGVDGSNRRTSWEFLRFRKQKRRQAQERRHNRTDAQGTSTGFTADNASVGNSENPIELDETV